MGVLLSKPSDMLRVNVAFLSGDREKVLRVLQEAGVVEVEPVEAEKVIGEYERLQSLRERINNLLQKAKGLVIDASITGVELASLDVDKVEKHVADLYGEVTLLEEKARHLRESIESLRMLLSSLAPLPDSMDAAEIYYEGRHVSSILLSGKQEAVMELLEKSRVLKASKMYQGGERVSVIVYLPAGDLGQVVSAAHSMGLWCPSKQLVEALQLHGSIGSLREHLARRISELDAEASRVEARITEIVKANGITLGKYLLFTENRLEYYRVSGAVVGLRHLSAVTGWIPRDSIRLLEDLVKSSGIPVFIEYKDPLRGVDNPPSRFNNKRALRYFQVITRLYGVPGYWEPDPTPLIAYSFAFFFGLMNSDAGYALAGLLAIALVMDKLVENPYNPVYREFKGALLVSNAVSLVLGLLGGSIFGDLLPSVFGVNVPALIPVFSQPVEFIKLALLIGLIHINIAHTLATVKFAREGRKGDLLNEAGLFISQLFGIPYVLQVFFKYQVPVLSHIPLNILLYLTLLGVAIVIVGNYVAMRGLGFLMWIFQLTGVLGDVMSYVRLAGVSLASFYMAVSFNMMVKLAINSVAGFIPGAAGVALAYVVSAPLLFMIHLVIMILSELGAFVHSLRLCMLEFLMKFYDGSGREYSPFSIIAFKRIVIT